MPKIRFVSRVTTGAVGAVAVIAGLAVLPTASVAKTNQIAMIQDGGDLIDPQATFREFRSLGANTVRIIVNWNTVLSASAQSSKTKPRGFNATDPNASQYAGWAPYDGAVNAAKQYGIKVDFTVTGGAPRWAEGKDIPSNYVNELSFAWKPDANAYGQFMTAVAKRYSGTFKPKGQTTALPRVSFWVIYNEPNFGQDLGPQATNTSRTLTGAALYRGIVDAGWKALHSTGHGRDTILIGELAARGFYLSNGKHSSVAPQGYPGNAGQTRALYFLRSLYCIGTNGRPLSGSAARTVSCPSSSRGFRNAHPGLFQASGFGDHPYPENGSPLTDGKTVDYATFPELGNLEATLDRANRAYGSSKKFAIYNDEYAYITNPPNGQRAHHYVSPATAAVYINWAEYLSWKSPRIASYMQYLLKDPANNTGPYAGFASGLEFNTGKHKATYDAYRLPVYMPKTSLRKGSSAEVWGAARPAPFLSRDGAQQVAIQVNGKTVQTVKPGRSGGYFDARVRFTQGGTLRLAYTYPKRDSLLPMSDLGTTVHSRSFTISVH
jgi:hypothetical protein